MLVEVSLDAECHCALVALVGPRIGGVRWFAGVVVRAMPVEERATGERRPAGGAAWRARRAEVVDVAVDGQQRRRTERLLADGALMPRRTDARRAATRDRHYLAPRTDTPPVGRITAAVGPSRHVRVGNCRHRQIDGVQPTQPRNARLHCRTRRSSPHRRGGGCLRNDELGAGPVRWTDAVCPRNAAHDRYGCGR